MPCRKERPHIVTYGIIDEGLRAGAGIDRICHGVRCRKPFAAPQVRTARPLQCIEVPLGPSGLKIEALRRFGGDGFYGIGLKLPLFAPIHEKPAQSG